MRLGIDIDGVLANFEAGYAPLVTRLTGVPFPRLGEPDWPDQWDWDQAAGVKPEDLSRIWDVIKADPIFWESLPPTRECASTLLKLDELRFKGASIYFLTARPGRTAQAQSIRWIEAQGYQDPSVVVTLTADEKASMARSLALDFFLDDKPENCVKVYETTGGDVWLLSRPWNRTFEGWPGLFTTDHPVKALEALEGQKEDYSWAV